MPNGFLFDWLIVGFVPYYSLREELAASTEPIFVKHPSFS